MRNQGLINSYCGYFESQLRVIFALPDVMYRKVLIVIVLDTLARARLPQLKARNHDRFIAFVKACGDWEDAGWVSLPQLVAHLNRNPKTAKGRLAQEASARLSNWEVGRMYPIKVDPEVNELIKLVKDPREKKTLESHQHMELLYTYRNVLVHEFREPGYAMGVLDDPTPYYYNMEDEQGVNRWELVYPINWFMRVAERSLEGMKGYLEKNDLDPYSFYEFGSVWRSAVGRV